ncbi:MULTISPECIES: hypothetical protein [Nostocales]|uniref:Uncharacterized protein n=3 Tax=Nostocales TaxID=1161 RepID=A0A8S9SRD0_9CYAN|nr:hypothetical protein DA73_0400038815 [Tolypothrix bouteillei VB521301]
MPQLQAVATNEQVIAQQEFEKYVKAQGATTALQTGSDSFEGLAQSTSHILNHALWLAQQKEQLSKREYRQLLNCRGWKNEDRKYLKVAAAFKQFSDRDLTQIEPATIFQLANNPKKYQSVIDLLQTLTEINQSAVRDLIVKQRQPKEPKQELPSIWRRTKNGGRYCQIPPIQETDERTGTALQKMMDDEGLTAQRIVAEAIALRQAYKEGRLMLVESFEPTCDRETSKDWETNSSNVWLDEPNTDIATKEFEEHIEGAWTFEPDPEKDEPVEDDGEYSAVVESETECGSPSPVELLIETFQNASSWEPIREALLVHEDCKQQAWDVLTPIEKKRVRGLMPIEVKKLSEAKKAGLIVDFKELREGIYQVRRRGILLGEVVSSSGLDAFLTQL